MEVVFVWFALRRLWMLTTLPSEVIWKSQKFPMNWVGILGVKKQNKKGTRPPLSLKARISVILYTRPPIHNDFGDWVSCSLGEDSATVPINYLQMSCIIIFSGIIITIKMKQFICFQRQTGTRTIYMTRTKGHGRNPSKSFVTINFIILTVRGNSTSASEHG